ncbi:hypothetical protein [Psychrobacter immobilis]|uniref:hypothetical protein n=1 Tax=Psychrobacter immobilis TaxID=498 RepID=UPI001917DEDD|nr:hypothetical protein [Psychrobacter immobilis]
MDIDKILHTKVEVNNDREKLTAYNFSRGPSYSLNENLVPEQLFDNPDTSQKEADGISATKALSLAAQQGQTIYTITKANYAEVLPKLNHSDVVMTDIRNGINAGKTVTVHDTQITLNGWSGTGYTILDPESGAGAYMIGGGLDGGFVSFIKSLKGKNLKLVASLFIGFLEKRPNLKILLKSAGGVFGQLITTVVLGVKFYTQCTDSTNALALTLVFSLISISIALALFFIFAPWVGLIASILIGQIENRIANVLISRGC